jgi:hypothetical protein
MCDTTDGRHLALLRLCVWLHASSQAGGAVKAAARPTLKVGTVEAPARRPATDQAGKRAGAAGGAAAAAFASTSGKGGGRFASMMAASSRQTAGSMHG